MTKDAMINEFSQPLSGVKTAKAGLHWLRWTPYAALAWSVVYAALGLYWVLSGRGFPYAPGLVNSVTGPLAGRIGQAGAWIIMMAAGIPAVVLGVLMLRGVTRLRLVLIAAGALIATVLLLMMTDFELLMMIAYLPFVIFRLLTGAGIDFYMQTLSETGWVLAHQVLCLSGGFLWLAATLSYTRRSTRACLYCGRRDGPEGWTSPERAARWGRIAAYISIAVPLLYAATRYAWAVGIPLGMSVEHWRQGQEIGKWVSGLFLANFALLGAVLTLGLVQRWGEVFPRWMVGLAGRRVPIALAVVPAVITSVLFVVGGMAIVSGWVQMGDGAQASGENVWIVVGPAALLPLWGIALAVATLGYYYRRRGVCEMCGGGTPVRQKNR